MITILVDEWYKFKTRFQTQLSWDMSTPSGILNVSAAPNFLHSSPIDSSSRSLSRSSGSWTVGDAGSRMLLDLQSCTASIFTWPRWEISTTTVSSSTGRGCFHGSPSILMYVWSVAPLWNSNLIRCAYMQQQEEETDKNGTTEAQTIVATSKIRDDKENKTNIEQSLWTWARRLPCPFGASKTSPCQASLKPTISIRPSSTKGGVKSLWM